MTDIPQSALDLFKRDEQHWAEIYDKAKEDLHFLSDDKYAQWNQADYDDRETTGRPVVTVDQLSQFVHQVSNDIRQNTPTFTVIPDDSDSTEDTAEAFRAVIRGIEYKSNADDVYDTAANAAVKSSIGFIRIDHDYYDDEGFDQELCIKRVINPLSVFLDKDSIECDGRDAKHCTILDKMKVAEFKKRYPKAEVVPFESEKQVNKDLKDTDDIQYAEFFQLAEEEKVIALDSAGKTFEWQDGLPFEAKRSVRKSRVKRFKLSGKEILEETYFPGKYIPIIPVYGEEHWQEGKRHLFSLIRKAKNAQMMYNVWKSLETEIIMKQPQAPVMVAEGSIEDYMDDWKKPQKSMALRYRTQTADGAPLPPPQRLEPPTIPAGIINAAREAVEDIKASMGLYNAALGMRGSATSGKQEIAQQKEGDVATFHFYDNLVRSITHVYRVLIAAIPEIYDTPRILRAIGKEEEPLKLGVNGQLTEEQEETIDLTKGKFTVRVVPGASYTTKRQEAAAFYADVVTKMPELMNVMGDLLFKYSDMAGAEAMSERMKKAIDPKFLEDNEEDPEKAQLKMALQELTQQMQGLQQELSVKDTESKLQKMQVDVQTKDKVLSIKEQLAISKIQNAEKDLIIARLQAEKQINDEMEQVEESLEQEFMTPDQNEIHSQLPQG